MAIQVDHKHYLADTYEKKERFISYWHQIDEIIKFKPKNILEIGVGSGFVSKYLKERGYDVTTFDHDASLDPDFVGDVTKIPFKNSVFDVVACCQVLEHIPYEQFRVSLREIERVARNGVVISLPDNSRTYPILIKLLENKYLRFLVRMPRFKKILKYSPEHCWEIGDYYSLQRIMPIFSESGLILKNTYRVFENPYHRFFIANKIDL